MSKQAVLNRPPKAKLKQRPKLERSRPLKIAPETMSNVKKYRESLDRQVLRQRLEENKISTCMLLFEKHPENKQDFLNDRSMVINLWAFSFLQKAVDYSKHKYRYTWITVGKLEHSWMQNQDIKACMYNKETGVYAGYGTAQDYTRYKDGTQSISFVKAHPLHELKTKLMYWNFMCDSRKINLPSLVAFGCTILDDFNDLFEANESIFHLYIDGPLFANFLYRFEEAEFHLQDSLWNSVKPKHIGRRCSILGFSKHK